MATVIDNSVPLGFAQTLGTILSSVVEAQSQSARATVDFIDEVAFREDESGPTEELRMVKFRYSKLDENQASSSFMVEIPLLGLVDIPLVNVSKAKISFSYAVTQTSEAPPTQKTTRINQFTRSFLNLSQPIDIKGRFAKRPATSSTPVLRETSNLDVEIEIEKSPLPVGIERVLEILELAAAETTIPENDEQ